jgi:hypothetical protein
MRPIITCACIVVALGLLVALGLALLGVKP